jgi:hypothetical protein
VQKYYFELKQLKYEEFGARKMENNDEK